MALQLFRNGNSLWDPMFPFAWPMERELMTVFKDDDSGSKALTPILSVDLIEGENNFSIHAGN